MPEDERRRNIPEWAEWERLADLAWIVENMTSFWAFAQQGLEASGRGGIVVDTTLQPDPDRGHPMWYFAQEQIPLLDFTGEDEIRMVAEYDPSWEFVAMLLKQAEQEERVSSYRVGVPDQRRPAAKRR